MGRKKRKTINKGLNGTESISVAVDSLPRKPMTQVVLKSFGADGVIGTVDEKTNQTQAPVRKDVGLNETRSNNMAISLEKYVDINSTFPAEAMAARTFGGIVFTVTEMLTETVASAEKTAYDSGEAVALTLSGTKTHFGITSDEYKFALRYYGYTSPSGNIPCALKFTKVMTVTPSEYAAGNTYNVGDYVKHTVSGTSTNYQCTTKVELSTDWDTDSSSFTVVTGTIYETADAAFTRISNNTNLFGSFTFLDSSAVGGHVFSAAELVNAATVNSGLKVRFLDVVNDVRGQQLASAVVTKKETFSSIDNGLVFVSGYDNCSAAMPMAILAATNYSGGTVTNFMFKQFGNETPTVTTDAEYETFSTANVNFYGRTQSNGQIINFYQRGYNTDGTETSVYCNELWFKSACSQNLIQLLVNNERVPANSVGIQMVEGVILDICASAVTNGTFMPKTVGTTAKSQIRSIIIAAGGSTEDGETIISGIESSGYAVYAYIDTPDDGEKICHYYVFYGTADSIRFIQGDDVMVK